MGFFGGCGEEQRSPPRNHRRSPSPTPLPCDERMHRLRRVFNIDVSKCSRCGGALRVLAVITEPAAIRAILKHLDNRAARAPPTATRPLRFPPSSPFRALASMGRCPAQRVSTANPRGQQSPRRAPRMQRGTQHSTGASGGPRSRHARAALLCTASPWCAAAPAGRPAPAPGAAARQT